MTSILVCQDLPNTASSSLDVGHGIGRGLPNDNENSFNATTAKYGRGSYILVVVCDDDIFILYFYHVYASDCPS